MIDQSGTKDTLLNHGSDTHFNTRLIVAITVTALMVVIIVILTPVLCFVIYTRVKNQKNDVPMATNEAYVPGLQDTAAYTQGDTYDYPCIDDQATSSINTKKNEAYAMNAEVKPCIAYATRAETKPCLAYATNITTERNDAYAINLQDVVMCREGDTYDYPTMDS